MDPEGTAQATTEHPATGLAKTRRRAKRSRIFVGSLIALTVAIAAATVVSATARPAPVTSPAEVPAAVAPALTSCAGFFPKPVPSPDFTSALKADPDLIGSADAATWMTECEARMAAEQNTNLGEPIGDLTSPTTSRFMTLAEADELMPTGVLKALPADRPVWVVTVHRQTARYTPPGVQSKTASRYSVIYDAQSSVTIASELGSDALVRVGGTVIVDAATVDGGNGTAEPTFKPAPNSQ